MVAPEPALLEQLAATLNIYNDLQMRAEIDEANRIDAPLEISPIQYQLAGAFVAAAVSAVENATGRNSTRSQFARKFAEGYDKLAGGVHPGKSRSIAGLKGIVEETHAAILKGHLVSYEEIIHVDMFGDMLEMAEELQKGGRKELAAAVAGTALEIHLKKLCAKNSVVVVGNAARMNDDLKRAGAYGDLQHKQVTAWQQIRNDAAHGEWDKFDFKDVAHLIMEVRDFIAKYPA